MPRVPSYEGRKVSTTALPGVRKQAAETPESLGAGVGEAIARTGNTLARAGIHEWQQRRERERKKANEVAHLAAVKRLSDWEITRLHDAKTGVLTTRKGQDSFTLPEEIDTEYEQVAGELRASATNDEQKLAVDQLIENRRNAVRLATHRHVEQQRAEYDASLFKGVRANQAQLATIHAGEPAKFLEAMGNIVAATQQYHTRNGAPKEVVDAEVATAQSAVWEAGITQLLADGNDQGAKRYYDEARTAGQLTGDALKRMTEAVKRKTTEMDGERAADAIYAELGPKGDDDPISLDVMEARARERFTDEPEKLKATVAALRSRKQGIDDGRRERREAKAGTLWRAVLDGKSVEQIKRMPEYITGDDKVVLSVVDYLETQKQREADRAFALEGRALAERDRAEKRREDAGWYMRHQYDQPAVLLQMRDDQIYALTPELGQRHVAELLERKRKYQEDASTVRRVNADRELFNEFAVEYGLNPHKVKKTEEEKNRIGGALSAVEDALGRAQQKHPKVPLSREESRAVVQEVFDQQVKLRGSWWTSDVERVAAAVVHKDDIARAYVPIQDVPADAVTEGINYLLSNGLVDRDHATRSVGELKLLYAPRLERAYAMRVLGQARGKSAAEIRDAITKALKGQE